MATASPFFTPTERSQFPCRDKYTLGRYFDQTLRTAVHPSAVWDCSEVRLLTSTTRAEKLPGSTHEAARQEIWIYAVPASLPVTLFLMELSGGVGTAAHQARDLV